MSTSAILGTSNNIVQFFNLSNSYVGFNNSNPSTFLDIAGNVLARSNLTVNQTIISSTLSNSANIQCSGYGLFSNLSIQGSNLNIGTCNVGCYLQLNDVVNAAWQLSTPGYKLSFNNQNNSSSNWTSKGSLDNYGNFLASNNITAGLNLTATSNLYVTGISSLGSNIIMNSSNGSTTLFANGGNFGNFINPQYALDINGAIRGNNNISTTTGAFGCGLSNPLCQIHVQAPNAINANSNNIFMDCFNVVGYPTISFNGYYQSGFHYMNNTNSIFRIGNEQRVSNDAILCDITEPSGAGFCLWYGNSNGLGINSTNPQYTLDINGTTNIAGNAYVSSTFSNSGNAYFQNATINGTLTLNSALNTPNFINLTKMNNNSNAITINLNWTSNVTNPSYFSIVETTQTISANNSNGSRRCRYAISMSNSGIAINAIESADVFGNNTNAYTSLLINSVGTTTNSISIQSATNWITSSTPCTHIFTLQTISYPFGNVGVMSLT